MVHDSLQSFLSAWETARDAGNTLAGCDDVLRRTIGFRDVTKGEEHMVKVCHAIVWVREDLTEVLLPFEITSGEFKEKFVTRAGRVELFGGEDT
jgi:hypothetical protein